MDRVTLCLLLLLMVLIPKQSDSVSYRCNKLLGDIASSATALTELLLNNQTEAGQCLDYLTNQCHTFQPNSITLTEFETVNSALNTTIDIVTETVQLLSKKAQELQKNQQQLPTTNAVRPLKQTEGSQCGPPQNVCRKLEDAINTGSVDRVKSLFKCTEDSCTIKYGINTYTPLQFAANNGQVDVLKVLLVGGANTERTITDQWTALHYAASAGHERSCRVLLDWGAKVDPMDSLNKTPLHRAAELGKLKAVKLLVEKGADLSLKNRDNENASKLAQNKGHNEVADWLNSEYGKQLATQNHLFNVTCRNLKLSEAVNSDIGTQIQSMEEVLNRNAEKQKQLKTAISRLTEAFGLQNQMVHGDVLAKGTCVPMSTGAC